MAPAEIASKRDTDIQVKSRSPHEDEVLAELVDLLALRVFLLFGAIWACDTNGVVSCFGRVEEEFESSAEALADVQIL